MKVGGMIGYYPGTIWLDFGIVRVKGQGHEKVKLFLNRMEFGGMIGYYLGTIWLDFGIDRAKGQDQGHEKLNIIFLSNWHATNANNFIIQCPILWYAKVCALPSAHSSWLLILQLFAQIHSFPRLGFRLKKTGSEKTPLWTLRHNYQHISQMSDILLKKTLIKEIIACSIIMKYIVTCSPNAT